jgi:hypothetical protein
VVCSFGDIGCGRSGSNRGMDSLCSSGTLATPGSLMTFSPVSMIFTQGERRKRSSGPDKLFECRSLGVFVRIDSAEGPTIYFHHS